MDQTETPEINPAPQPGVKIELDPTQEYYKAGGLSPEESYRQATQGLLTRGLNDVNSYLTGSGTDMNRVYADYVKKGPYQGSLSDYMMENSPVGRILSAFGQGVKDGWGAGHSFMEDEMEKETKDIKNGTFYAFSASLMRAKAAALDFVTKAPLAIMGGISGGLMQTGAELPRPSGELVQEAASGALPESAPEGGIQEIARGVEASKHVPPVDLRTQVFTARANGVTGEGEEGYFGTREPTKEQLQSRQEAAGWAGLPETPEYVSDVPDIDTLARDVAPDTFKEWDNLQAFQMHLRSEIQRFENLPTDEGLGAKKQAILERMNQEGYTITPKDQEDLAFIENARSKNLQENRELLQEADLRLRDLGPQVAEARQRVQDMLQSEDPSYRNYVQAQALENAMRAQEIAPRIQEAVTHAQSLLPDTAEEAFYGVLDGKSQETSTSTSQGKKPVSEAPNGSSRASTSGGQTENPSGGSRETQTGIFTTSGGSIRLEAEGLQKDLEAVQSELPEFQSINKADQAARLSAYLANKPEEAILGATKGGQVPPDINPQALFVAVTRQARLTGDTDLIQRLARSPLNKQHSLAGQTLSMLQGINDLNPVSIIGALNKIKESQADIREVQTLDKQLSAIAEKARAEFAPQIESFMKSIACEE